MQKDINNVLLNTKNEVLSTAKLKSLFKGSLQTLYTSDVTLSNTTNTNPTPTNVGQTPSSLSHTSIFVETFDYLIRNQQTNVNSSNVQPQDLSFPLPIVISIIIGTIVAAGVVLGAYYNLKSDITALSVRIGYFR